jgi:hypothetical protein
MNDSAIVLLASGIDLSKSASLSSANSDNDSDPQLSLIAALAFEFLIATISAANCVLTAEITVLQVLECNLTYGTI